MTSINSRCSAGMDLRRDETGHFTGWKRRFRHLRVGGPGELFSLSLGHLRISPRSTAHAWTSKKFHEANARDALYLKDFLFCSWLEHAGSLMLQGVVFTTWQKMLFHRAPLSNFSGPWLRKSSCEVNQLRLRLQIARNFIQISRRNFTVLWGFF